MRKDMDNLKDKFWLIELMTLECVTKRPHYYKEIF